MAELLAALVLVVLLWLMVMWSRTWVERGLSLVLLLLVLASIATGLA